MNEVINKTKIEDMIYEVRGKQVILDRDLARLYEVETRTINQRVKRNIERFPENFCFQLTKEEFKNWKSQIVISNSDKQGLRKCPYVFTEQGGCNAFSCFKIGDCYTNKHKNNERLYIDEKIYIC